MLLAISAVEAILPLCRQVERHAGLLLSLYSLSSLDEHVLNGAFPAQFVVLKPLISIAAIVTEAFGLYCATSQSFAFANVYLEIVDFVSVTVALYGLVRCSPRFYSSAEAYHGRWTLQIILYTLTHAEYVLRSTILTSAAPN